MGASRSSVPFSASIMTAVAVIDFVTEARRYDVRDVAATPRAGSASPKPADQTSCPSSAMATDSAGAPERRIQASTARAMLAVSMLAVADARGCAAIGEAPKSAQ